MPVLGHAIASYLSGLRGQYSVELPISLVNEMEDVVSECNRRASTGNHALFVANEPLAAPGNTTISWGEILKWRTDDDRIFVWARGIREPDTSFRSVVRPFISSHFPGDNGGECTIELLSQLSVEELWRRRNLPLDGDSFRAFYETFKWIADVLLYSFEQVGSTPDMHWSDQFLVHWSEVLQYLDQGLASMPTVPVARHAWEIVRAAGLPVPSSIAGSGNPFIEPPKDLEGKRWDQFAEEWQKTVDEFLRTEGNVAVFLTALDAQVPGAGNVSPWRGLGWGAISGLPEDVAAPILGKAVFTAPSVPSILSVSVPNYIAAPTPSWWGVTDRDIQKAVDQLHGAIELRPTASCNALFPVFSGVANSYLLETRNGAVTYTSTPREWRTRVSFTDLQVEYRGNWERLTIAPLQPSTAQESDAWINPDDVSLDFKGSALKITGKPVFAAPGFRLAIPFDLAINYVARIDTSTNNASGSWNPVHTLRLKARVSYYMNGTWTRSLPLESMATVIVPSPFSPSIMIAAGNKVLLSPDKGDTFLADLNVDDWWQPESTPDILLPEEGEYELKVYQGSLEPRSPRFAPVPALLINGVVLSPGAASGAFCSLDSGDVIVADQSNRTFDVVVIKVKERSSALSSGLLAAVRGKPARHGRPSSLARGSVLGRYQDKVTRALCSLPGNLPDSLYQYVISSTEGVPDWPSHRGTPSPDYLFNTRGLTLPGIGNGPTPALTGCPEWVAFMKALADICSAVGLRPGADETWLSSIDPSVIPARTVKSYTDAHRDLVLAARDIGPADAFWATYPFSLVIVDGKPGGSFGQLLAVLLSPLHPARLNWAFSVAFTARRRGIDRSLLGLAEGWNIPYTGQSVNMAGQPIPLVAIPTDPGTEQDFAAWSALAVLERSGLAGIPSVAAGLPLPWGGRTGINDRVVERAITDYLDTYPHLNSLEVDIRAVSSAPRSQEIDNAVLRFVGTRTLPGVDKLGGSTRVWDSANRLGEPPTRDNLFIVRKEDEPGGPFEWKIYQPPAVPTEADIALIENSSVNLAIDRGDQKGIMGALPLRRFCPSTLDNLMFDQNFAASPGEDLLGLSSLLAVIEYHGGEKFPILRATPQINGLGVGMGARWEVLGTFNLDPSLLSSVIATGTRTTGKRLLWEWRPSWLIQGRANQDELAQRPYYVIARVPISLLKALEYRQGLTEQQGLEMLTELGYRGIGLASLQAAGGTQESAAAGFFYALRLLLPSAGHPAPATWSEGNSVAVSTVLPVDPITSLLAGLAGRELRRRADLLVVQIARPVNGSVHLCFVPVEIKHHGQMGHPERIQANDQELLRAREQLTSTVEVIEKIAEAIHQRPGETPDPFGSYARYVGLATLLDLAMSLAPVQPDLSIRGDILRAVLDGRVEIGIGDPVLLWFAPGSLGINGAACLVDPFRSGVQPSGHPTRELFIDPAATAGLWWAGQPVRADDMLTRNCIDDVMRSSMAVCTSSGEFHPAPSIRSSLAEVLGLEISPAIEGGQHNTSTSHAKDGVTETKPEESVTASSVAQASALAQDALSQAGEVTGKKDIESPIVSRRDETLHLNSNDAPGQNEATRARSNELGSLAPPRSLVGWTTLTSRWALIGKFAGTNDTVALDLDHPKAMGVFGYMGSGKSYLLGTLIEGAVEQIPGINQLPVPLAVVVFNYRRNASDRFELASLMVPNRDETDTMRLATSYGAAPQPLHNVHVLALPGELVPARLKEYDQLSASELFFNPATLSVEDWELLMGEPGSEAVFARTIRHALVELRSSGQITFEQLEDRVLSMLVKQSRSAAQLRFDFIRRYLSSDHGVDFEQVLQPGRVVIVDLRQPLFNKDDALRFFLVCANQVSQVQGRFNKLIIFDEAHEYLSDEFGERIEARIRQMRHEGTSYIFATQDVRSIPLAIRRFITTRFVFSLGTRENVDDLVRFAPEFKGQQLLGMPPGYCLAQANQSIDNVFERPRLIHIRPRVTQHGGATQIFSTDTQLAEGS
jgi:hypothetical protein